MAVCELDRRFSGQPWTNSTVPESLDENTAQREHRFGLIRWKNDEERLGGKQTLALDDAVDELSMTIELSGLSFKRSTN